MEDQTFPKYQYSEFIKSGGRDAQIVVRSNEWEEFETLLKQALSIVKAASKQDEAPNPSNDVMEKYLANQKPTQGDVPACPECGGEMWDNRPKKASGLFKKNSPDFKCKNADCGSVIWPPKN